MFVVVDVEDFLRSSKTLHQSRELTPVAIRAGQGWGFFFYFTNSPTNTFERRLAGEA
jgi:hypothetical protein